MKKTICSFGSTILSAVLVMLVSAAALAADTVLKIDGMSCSGCESTIKEKVATSSQLAGKVESCVVDSKKGTATLRLMHGVKMSQSEIETAVGEALKDTPYTLAKNKKDEKKKTK